MATAAEIVAVSVSKLLYVSTSNGKRQYVAAAAAVVGADGGG